MEKKEPQTELEAPSGNLDRRTFLKAGGAALAASALGMTASSYTRVLGANDRIRLGQLGCGDRSGGHVHMVQAAAAKIPVETVAVCDLWSRARERRAADVQQRFGQAPRQYKYSEELLKQPDIDGVMIATGDFQHAKLCMQVVQAGKDCYVEKPFANVLQEAKDARAAVKASRQVVQMGTQHRSQPYNLAVRDVLRTGRIGPIMRIEQEWSVNHERWRGRPEVAELKEQDTDWNRWLLGKPFQPFDPRVYLEFRLYKKFSSGIFDQWMSHGVDLVHLWTDATAPQSVVANGGVFVWKDGRENGDTVSTTMTYPQGFLYTYSTTFGNSYRCFSRIQGTKGTIVNYGGEGASLFEVTNEGQEHDPVSYDAPPGLGPAEDKPEIIRIAGVPANTEGPEDDDPLHVLNWLRAMRDRRQPNANVDHGFSHAVACIMAAEAYWSGKRVCWDAEKEEIVEHSVPDSKSGA
ncbi:MAG TPA: Gfo/Idh/MocA family oxidoreductase [Terriglobales bacterium]